MTSSQKILLAVLAIVFLVFIALFFGINTYNNIAGLEAAVDPQWINFERVYQPRFEFIQRLTARVEAMGTTGAAVEQIKPREVNYSQARTVERRVRALIDLEGALKKELAAIGSNEKVKNDAQVSQLIKSLAGSGKLLMDQQIKYNEAVSLYNQSLRQFPNSILADYFSFTPKTQLPDLWAAE